MNDCAGQIERWAHMLDEAFRADGLDEAESKANAATRRKIKEIAQEFAAAERKSQDVYGRVFYLVRNGAEESPGARPWCEQELPLVIYLNPDDMAALQVAANTPFRRSHQSFSVACALVTEPGAHYKEYAMRADLFRLDGLDCVAFPLDGRDDHMAFVLDASGGLDLSEDMLDELESLQYGYGADQLYRYGWHAERTIPIFAAAYRSCFSDALRGLRYVNAEALHDAVTRALYAVRDDLVRGNERRRDAEPSLWGWSSKNRAMARAKFRVWFKHLAEDGKVREKGREGQPCSARVLAVAALSLDCEGQTADELVEGLSDYLHEDAGEISSKSGYRDYIDDEADLLADFAGYLAKRLAGRPGEITADEFAKMAKEAKGDLIDELESVADDCEDDED